MRARRRVSLGQSIKLASKGTFGTDDPTGDASMITIIVFGLWWWIAGVPAGDKDDGGKAS